MPQKIRRILPSDEYREEEQEVKQNSNPYISGNVVPMPQIEEPIKTPEKKVKKAKKPEKEEIYAPRVNMRRSIDFVTMMMLCAALAVCAYMAYSYLAVSARSIEVDKKLNALETQYNALVDANDNRLDAIVANTDLNEIYEVAVGRLGMVYPNNNQVIYYEYQGDGYVRQYASIPELNEDNSLAMESILNRIFAN